MPGPAQPHAEKRQYRRDGCGCSRHGYSGEFRLVVMRPESGMREVSREGHNQRKQDHEVYLRVKRAERGDWIGLLRHYVDKMEAGKQHESQVMLSAWRMAE